MCFVREPAQQIRSHFEHFVRGHGYKKSFIEFIQEPRFINFQSKHLRGVPLTAIGFIGLTEKYDESLKMINDEYGFSIPAAHLNQNKDKTNHEYQFSDEEIELIQQLNQEDFDLYENVKNLFARRLESKKRDLPFYRGEFTLQALPKPQRGKFIHGWLADYNAETPACGYVTINDDIRVDIEAKDYRPWVKEKTSHRMGFVGFHVKLDKELQEGDKLNLYDENHQLICTQVFSHE